MTFRGRWQPNYVQYNVGDIVEYNGCKYKNIQAHKSQDDWPPSATPALWENLGSDCCHNCGGSHPDGQCQSSNQDSCCGKCGNAHSAYQPCSGQDANSKPCGNCGQPHPGYQPCQGNQNQQTQYQDQQKPDAPVQGGYSTGGGVQVSEPETQKKWYDLDDKRKDELLAGGLALGLGALAGGLFYAHKKHKLSEEEEKQQAWQLQNWIKAAEQRTQYFLTNGPQGPVTWIYGDVLERRPDLQHDMIPVDQSAPSPWFIIRSPHLGGVQVGKFKPSENNGNGVIGFKKDAIQVKKFEVLIGAHSGVRWIPARGKLDREDLQGARPVEGGSEDNGTQLYIARARVHNEYVPGKASAVLDGAYITVGDDEKKFDEYDVLVYN